MKPLEHVAEAIALVYSAALIALAVIDPGQPDSLWFRLLCAGLGFLTVLAVGMVLGYALHPTARRSYARRR